MQTVLFLCLLPGIIAIMRIIFVDVKRGVMTSNRHQVGMLISSTDAFKSTSGFMALKMRVKSVLPFCTFRDFFFKLYFFLKPCFCDTHTETFNPATIGKSAF